MIKNFTHTDLDGIGCYLLIDYFHGNTDVTFCDYNNVNQIIETFIGEKEYLKYSTIYITDISVNEVLAKKIDKLIDEEGINFELIDHHPTALGLNAYQDWVTVRTHDKHNNKISATRLLYEKFLNTFNRDAETIQRHISYLVHHIDMYDTWRWFDENKDPERSISKYLNDILKIIGRKRFIEYAKEDNLETDDMYFLHTIYSEKNEKIIKSLNYDIKKATITFNNKEYEFGYVFTDGDFSDIGNSLYQLNPDLEFVAMFNLNRNILSLRSSIDKKIDLSELAKAHGGGGHKNAAGCKIQGKFLELVKKHLNI